MTLNWLRNWWRKKQRRIFVYWDGVRIRRVDPILIHRGLRLVEDFDIENDLKAMIAGKEDAALRCLNAARKVFEIPAFSEVGGLTEDETLDVLAGFVIWVDELKKNSSPSQTSLEPMEPLQPYSGSSVVGTRPSADFSSTSPASSADVPAA